MNLKETKRKLIKTYMRTGNVSETARVWHTSRNVVRKRVQRYQEEGLPGLQDRSRRPKAFFP